MKTYALFNADGSPHEIFTPLLREDGTEIPLAERFHPDFVAQLGEYDPLNPPPVDVPEPVVKVPPRVTMRQARLALLAAGKLSEVDAAIAALSSPQREAAKIEWDYSATVDRDSPIVALLGPALDLDQDALDALFTLASDL